MPKVLTRLKVTEISAVDRGAGENVKILLAKRADPDDDFEAWREEQAEIAERQNEEHLRAEGYDERADEDRKARRAASRKFFEDIFFKRRDANGNDLERHSEVVAPDDGPKDSKTVADEFQGGGYTHLAVRVADMLVKTGGREVGQVFSNREEALHWLLHSAPGFALLRHMSIHKQESIPMTTDSETRAETIAKLLKAHGVVAIAKSIIEDEESPLSEHELTALATEHAKSLHPTLTAPQAFAKFIETPDGIEVLKAMDIAKTSAWLGKALPPTLDFEVSVVGGVDAVHEALEDRSKAYDQLVALAAKMRERVPELSPAQAFERVYMDPTNVALATAAGNPPQPSAYLAFPRDHFDITPPRQ